MSEQITGFDIYSLYISLKIHFSSRDYYMHKLIPVKWSTYQSHKQYHIFEYLSHIDMQPIDIRNYFIANIITNESINPSMFKNKNTFKIFERWKRDVADIENVFAFEYRKILDAFKVTSLTQLNELIKTQLTENVQNDYVHVDNIQQVIDDLVVRTSDTYNNDLLQYIGKININAIIVLDEIIQHRFKYSFLQLYIDQNKQLKCDPLLTALKYKFFIGSQKHLSLPFIHKLVHEA